MIIENFLIFQNVENSRIRISGKFSLPYQTVPYSHHISSAYPTTHQELLLRPDSKAHIGYNCRGGGWWRTAMLKAMHMNVAPSLLLLPSMW